MPYYPTLQEDIAHAKEILKKGQPSSWERAQFKPEVIEALRRVGGGVIYGADIYAAYKLLESFVTEIERLQAERIVAVTARCSVCGNYCDQIEFEYAKGQEHGSERSTS